MAIEIKDDLFCCALAEITNISNTKPDHIIGYIISGADHDLAEEFLYDDPGKDSEGVRILKENVKPIILFTGAKRTSVGLVKYAERLGDYITENNLGEVDRINPVKNPNSGNHVTLYIWQVSYEGLLAWWHKNNQNNNHSKH